MSFEQFKKPQDKAKTDTKNWYSDRYQTVLVQRNLLFIATLASLAAALITAMLIYVNIPLVTVEPFAIEVDRRSGIVQTVQPLALDATAKDERINNYMLINYLRAFETVNISDFAYSLTMIRISSVPDIFSEFLRTKNPYDKDTVAGAVMAARAKRDIVIKSIYYLRPGHVQIRFITQDKSTNGTAAPEHFLANIKFEYREIKLNIDEAFLNPLGFYVTSYDVSKEAI